MAVAELIRVHSRYSRAYQNSFEERPTMSSDKEKLHILPIYINDFTSDELVEAMTTEEIGAYVLLLFKAWKSNPPATIPDDDETLARYARLSPARWQACKARVLAPWQSTGDGRLVQKRLKHVYADVVDKVTKTRTLASNRARSRWDKRQHPSQSTDNRDDATAQQHCCSNAAALQQHVPSIPPALLQQCKSNSNSKSKDTSHEVSLPPNPPGGMLGVGRILVEGEPVDFDEDPLRWQAEFIRRWNELAGVRRHGSTALSSFNLQLLRERLAESDWYWERAFEKFPLYLPSRIWEITLGTFLEPPTVSKILDGKYERPAHQTGLFPGHQADEPWRIRTGNSSETLRQAMAEVLAERS